MKHFFKWTAIIVCSLILLLAFVVGSLIGWLKWSGEREWKRAGAELREKGEKMTFAELIPSAPPDAENFCADPLWLELFTSGKPKEQWQINQWQKPMTDQEIERLKALLPQKTVITKSRSEALAKLKKILREPSDPKLSLEAAELTIDLAQPAAPVLSRISELSNRQRASFPINYQEGFGTSLPHVTVILSLGQVLQSRSLAELLIGDSQHASDDIIEILALQKSLIGEPFFIPFLVRQSLIAIAADCINKGINLHQWNDATLALFQQKLGEIHLQQDLYFCLRGERASATALLENLKQNPLNHHPSVTVQSLLLLQVSHHYRIIQSTLENLEFPEGKPWNFTVPVFPEIQRLKQSNRLCQVPYILSLLSLPALDGAVIKTVENQTQTLQTIIACALERYRIAHGSYPSSLDVLSPDYLTKIPNSPITGKPMNYSLQPEGTFQLWSLGWNLNSLGGKPGEFTGDGDIVWGQALPTKSKP
jgi:hypothetical protein